MKRLQHQHGYNLDEAKLLSLLAYYRHKWLKPIKPTDNSVETSTGGSHTISIGPTFHGMTLIQEYLFSLYATNRDEEHYIETENNELIWIGNDVRSVLISLSAVACLCFLENFHCIFSVWTSWSKQSFTFHSSFLWTNARQSFPALWRVNDAPPIQFCGHKPDIKLNVMDT